MTTIVETCWGPRPIDDAPYWHLVGTSWLFYNNVRVGKGALLSVSAGIEAEPHIHNAQTPYSFARRDDAKEALFEDIRRTKYPHRPPRLKTLYVFDDYSLVQDCPRVSVTPWISHAQGRHGLVKRLAQSVGGQRTELLGRRDEREAISGGARPRSDLFSWLGVVQ